MKVVIVCVLACLVFGNVGNVFAQSSSSTQQVRTYIKELSDISKESCKNLNQLKEKYESQNRPAAAESVQAAMHNLCSCMPALLKKKSSQYSGKDLKKRVTKRQFMQQFQGVIDSCAAAQLRYPFGKDCDQRFAEVKTDSTGYCRCMRRYLKTLSNAEATKIGRESSDYMDASRVAKEHNMPEPQKPRSYANFLQNDEACSAR